MKHNYKIGIDVGGSKIAAIAISGDGSVLFEKRLKTPKGSYLGVVESIIELVNLASASSNDQAGVGIGIPGSLSPATGLVQNANSTWLNGKDFFNDISAVLGRPVRVANDANCFALSESFDGAGKDAKTVFGVIIGTGCGGGLAIDQKLLAGRHAIAGEWGHTPLPWLKANEFPAPTCWCGRENCLELWISGSGLERDSRENYSLKLTADEIYQQASKGDKVCANLLEIHCDRLARGLAMITNILDPDVIVLGGGLSNMDHLYEQLPARMEEFVFADHRRINIKPPHHGDASGARGAAYLWD